MSDRSIFERLADTLPEKERKDLLEKIHQSMSFGDGGDENIYEKQMTSDEREVLIKQDLDRLSLVARFLIWLRSAVSGKSKKDLLVSSKIRALKAVINNKCPGLTGFETRDITAKFAHAVFGLYKLTLPVAAIYRKLLLRSKEMEGAFVRLLEGRYPQTRVTLSDVISSEALEQVYDEKGQEQAVRRVAIEKFDEFGWKLDDRMFSEVEDAIVPVFYLKDIVFFPFGSFFELFHFSVASMLPDQEPVFKSASAMLALEHLEKLYFALYNASKIASPFKLAEDVARYLLYLNGEAGTPAATRPAPRTEPLEDVAEPPGAEGSVDDGEAVVEAAARQAAAEQEGRDEELLVEDLTALFDAVRKFERQMPIAELIRYFLKDPYHRMYVYVPKLRMKDYYMAVVKVRILAELEKLAPALRVRVVEHKIEKLFKGQQLIEFLNYREYKSIDYETMGLPFFSRTWSLKVLYNFIRWYYREYVQELVKILGTVILVQNRVTRNKLLQFATAVEDLEQKIREFDASLSPDSEEGKLFHRLRATLGGDVGHQRMFRTIVLQKDTQVNSLLDRGRESFTGLQRVFEEVYTTPSEAVRERLPSRFYLNGKLQPLSSLLKDRAGYLRDFLTILLQILRLEGL
ncbi:MAG TPA: DUF5312 family protein [Spirochaetia bacterium]|nr:DUF5312 family protein [Spirochaetia bacterium]